MFASVRRASPRIVLATRASRRVRLSSTGRRGAGVHFRNAGDSTLRRDVSPLRGARIPLLAHALAWCERAKIHALGTRGHPRAPGAAYLARLRHAAGARRAALRLRTGALGDALARRADLLGREPLPRGRRHASADSRTRRRVRASARALSRPGHDLVLAFHRIPPAPRSGHDRLRNVHDRGAARAPDDADGAAFARRRARRSARGAPAAAHHGAPALPGDPRRLRVPDPHAGDRDRLLGDAVRARDEVRPQDGLRRRLLVHFCGLARGPLFLRLARAHGAALDARRLRRTAARLRRQPLRSRSGPAARSRLGAPPWPTFLCYLSLPRSSSFWSSRGFSRWPRPA